MKTLIALILSLAVASAALGGTFKVNYTRLGIGRTVTIMADSAYEARRTVQDMFPGAVVTNVRQVRR